jgi:hypothetical protein
MMNGEDGDEDDEDDGVAGGDGEEVTDGNRPRFSSAPGPFRHVEARLAELEAQNRADKAAKHKSTPFYIFALPALCDLLGTTLGGIGLLWVDGSVGSWAQYLPSALPLSQRSR